MTAVDVIALCAALGWAGILLAPGDAFAASISYRYFVALGPEAQWAAILIAAAAVHVAGVARGGWLRRASPLVMVGLWASASGLFFLANMVSLGGVLTASLAVGGVWEYLPWVRRHAV